MNQVWTHGLSAVALDLETTGVDPNSARVVTAALVVVQPGAVPSVTQWLLDPGVEIPAGATEKHGITTEHARTHGKPAAEGIAEIVGMLRAYHAAGWPIVAFNACYDLTILDREGRRHGLPPLTELEAVLDGFVLDKAVDRFRRGKRTLEVVCETYGVTLHDAHTADADAMAAAEVVAVLLDRYAGSKVLDAVDVPYGQSELYSIPFPSDLLALHEQQARWRKYQQASLRQYFDDKGIEHDGCNGDWPVQALPVGWQA